MLPVLVSKSFFALKRVQPAKPPCACHPPDTPRLNQRPSCTMYGTAGEEEDLTPPSQSTSIQTVQRKKKRTHAGWEGRSTSTKAFSVKTWPNKNSPTYHRALVPLPAQRKGRSSSHLTYCVCDGFVCGPRQMADGRRKTEDGRRKTDLPGSPGYYPRPVRLRRVQKKRDGEARANHPLRANLSSSSSSSIPVSVRPERQRCKTMKMQKERRKRKVKASLVRA